MDNLQVTSVNQPSHMPYDPTLSAHAARFSIAQPARMAGSTNLPQEIIDQIVEVVYDKFNEDSQRRVMKNLRLVNRSFFEAATPLFFRKVSLPFCSKIPMDLCVTTRLSMGFRVTSNKRLMTDSLIDISKSDYRLFVQRISLDKWVRYDISQPAAKIQKDYNILANVLGRFPDLRDLRLNLRGKEFNSKLSAEIAAGLPDTIFLKIQKPLKRLSIIEAKCSESCLRSLRIWKDTLEIIYIVYVDITEGTWAEVFKEFQIFPRLVGICAIGCSCEASRNQMDEDQRMFTGAKQNVLKNREHLGPPELYWIPAALQDKMSILPKPSLKYNSENSAFGGVLFDCKSGYLVRTGHLVEFLSHDDVARPLPSWDILELQWVMNRAAALSGLSPLNAPGNSANEANKSWEEQSLSSQLATGHWRIGYGIRIL
ncbi:hypothetical protein BJX99DRAFT_254088 [Aspergillus californicus]